MINNNVSGKSYSVPAGLMRGVGVSLLMTLAGAVVLATLVDKEMLAWQDAGYGMIIMFISASYLGAKVSADKIKRQRLLVSLMFAVEYIGILMATTALFFGGQYDGAGVTSLLVLCGSLLSAIVCSGDKRRKRRGGRRS